MQAISDDTIVDILTNNRGMCLIDVWAEWCSPCKFFAPVIERFAEIYNIPVYSLDADANSDTMRTYGVMSVPTILVIKDDKLVYTSIGAKPLQGFLAEMAPWFDTPEEAVLPSQV